MKVDICFDFYIRFYILQQWHLNIVFKKIRKDEISYGVKYCE